MNARLFFKSTSGKCVGDWCLLFLAPIFSLFCLWGFHIFWFVPFWILPSVSTLHTGHPITLQVKALWFHIEQRSLSVQGSKSHSNYIGAWFQSNRFAQCCFQAFPWPPSNLILPHIIECQSSHKDAWLSSISILFCCVTTAEQSRQRNIYTLQGSGQTYYMMPFICK